MKTMQLAGNVLFTPGELPELKELPKQYPHYTLKDLKNPVLERDQILRSLEGSYEADVDIASVTRNFQFKSDKARTAASYYATLDTYKARLPKLGRWVQGLWPKDEAVAADLAELGKRFSRRKIYVSCRPEDILRASATKHYSSCLGAKKNASGTELLSPYSGKSYSTNNTGSVLVRIVEEAPGIAVIYSIDENGMFVGRAWLHSGTIGGKPAVTVARTRYGENVFRPIQLALAELVGQVGDQGGTYGFQYDEWGSPLPKEQQKKTVMFTYGKGLKHGVYFDYASAEGTQAACEVIRPDNADAVSVAA